MKFYEQTDFEANQKEKRAALTRTLAMMAPLLALAVVAFVRRWEIVCSGSLIAAGAVCIFLYDLRIAPALRYGRYLAEVHSGLTRETVGQLMRIGSDPVYQDGVDFFEVILNIYEDLSEEGERRFLLDCAKEIPADLIGRDIVVTSHGSFLLDAREAKV